MSTDHSVALITDSTSDIPPELVRQYGIEIVPQILIWGGQELRDQVDIDSKTFYERLPKDPNHPSTSQPIPPDFVAKLNQVKEAGAKEAVIITISNQMSKTVDSARQAAAMVDFPVHVLDSLSVSMGLGFQVLAAAQARQAGGNAQAMLDAANRVRQTLVVNFTVDTLEYLHRGGRIGGAAKLVGTALSLKPQLYIDHRIGRIEPGERTRTRKKALERMVELFFEKMDTSRPMHIAVMHAAADDVATSIVERIKSECNPVELYVSSVSPVVGTHAGPGTIGLCGYYDA